MTKPMTTFEADMEEVCDCIQVSSYTAFPVKGEDGRTTIYFNGESDAYYKAVVEESSAEEFAKFKPELFEDEED